MDLLSQLLVYGIPIASLWAIVRYGPVKNRWWRHENPLGCALFLGGIAFMLGLLGTMLLYEDDAYGPLFGLIYSGPVGTLLGLLWGMSRARERRARGDQG